jgi:hypothetical protein
MAGAGCFHISWGPNRILENQCISGKQIKGSRLPGGGRSRMLGSGGQGIEDHHTGRTGRQEEREAMVDPEGPQIP